MTTRITLAEAAALAGLEQSTLRRAAIRRTLKAEREGPKGPRGIWYTTRADLDAYLAQRPPWSRKRANERTT